MIIREREPEVVYTTGSSDWAGANAIIALIVVAVLGVVVYYFSVVNSNRLDSSAVPQPPTIIQMPAQAPSPSSVTVNSPPAPPSSVTVNAPAQPAPSDVTVTPPAPTSTPDNTSNQ